MQLTMPARTRVPCLILGLVLSLGGPMAGAQVVAVVSTILVVTVLIFGGGLGIFEGALMYAAAGVAVWYLAKGTFWSRRDTQSPGGSPDPVPGAPVSDRPQLRS